RGPGRLGGGLGCAGVRRVEEDDQGHDGCEPDEVRQDPQRAAHPRGSSGFVHRLIDDISNPVLCAQPAAIASGRLAPMRSPVEGSKKCSLAVSTTNSTVSPVLATTSGLTRATKSVLPPRSEASRPVSARSSSMSGVTTGARLIVKCT